MLHRRTVDSVWYLFLLVSCTRKYTNKEHTKMMGYIGEKLERGVLGLGRKSATQFCRLKKCLLNEKFL